jgi:hypothetical protein
MKYIDTRRMWKKLEPKEYERKNETKDIGTNRIWKKLETKEYESYWNQKNMKEIRNKRIRKRY